MGKLRIFVEDEHSLALRFLARVRALIGASATEGKKTRVALSGGSVAEAFLPPLVQLGEQASGLEIFWCDERLVPLDDEQSNYRRAKELWFDDAKVPPRQIFPLVSEHEPQQAALEYERLLRIAAGFPLDLALLGVGPDGHIASLFPNAPALSSRSWVEVVHDAPKPPPERLTLTMEVFERTPDVIVAAFGENKADAIAESLREDSHLPLAQLLRRAPHVDLFLDDAASRLIDARLLSK